MLKILYKIFAGLSAAFLALSGFCSGVADKCDTSADFERYYDAEECCGYNLDFYGKLKNKTDVNALIIGDSIGEGFSGTGGNMWFQLLEKNIEAEYGVKFTFRNVSFGGNGTYCGYVSSKIFSDGTDYDLAVLCYGQNDGSPDELKLQYEAMLRALRTKYDNIAIISILESPQREMTPKMQVISELCEYYGIPVADTITPFNTSAIGYENLTTDGCHPNDEGQKIYCEAVMNVIKAELEKSTERYYAMPEPVNPSVRNYDRFRYLRASEFTRTDDLTYEIGFSFNNAMLGMDYEIQSGENRIEFYLDGELFHTKTATFNYDFTQRHIVPVCSGANARTSIKIVFMTKQAADSFRGLIINPDCAY